MPRQFCHLRGSAFHPFQGERSGHAGRTPEAAVFSQVQRCLPLWGPFRRHGGWAPEAVFVGCSGTACWRRNLWRAAGRRRRRDRSLAARAGGGNCRSGASRRSRDSGAVPSQRESMYTHGGLLRLSSEEGRRTAHRLWQSAEEPQATIVGSEERAEVRAVR